MRIYFPNAFSACPTFFLLKFAGISSHSLAQTLPEIEHLKDLG